MHAVAFIQSLLPASRHTKSEIVLVYVHSSRAVQCQQKLIKCGLRPGPFECEFYVHEAELPTMFVSVPAQLRTLTFDTFTISCPIVHSRGFTSKLPADTEPILRIGKNLVWMNHAIKLANHIFQTLTPRLVAVARQRDIFICLCHLKTRASCKSLCNPMIGKWNICYASA
ncbi:unnamed protein product [Prorocentrum cordatum]|uniref:Uncharacterized protein n=1 Tax=Prorocentrum cordatum TaxID=2364126 RepID=A0ABN9VDC9_9DINO|nr:unnamed protein product [Polarella glacialis]